MKPAILSKFLLVMLLPMALSGCLTHRTVTKGGQEVSSGYVSKRPLKEAIDNSQ